MNTQRSSPGRYNMSIGFFVMGFFMLQGFLLIYFRDFAEDKSQWIESYFQGKHFESRLAHVHGNLFGFLNILIGYLLWHFSHRLKNAHIISWLTLGGLLMPIGILLEIYMGLPPLLVLFGAFFMTSAVIILGYSFLFLKEYSE